MHLHWFAFFQATEYFEKEIAKQNGSPSHWCLTDELWYTNVNVITVLDSVPDLFTGRHRLLQKSIWEEIAKEQDLLTQVKYRLISDIQK